MRFAAAFAAVLASIPGAASAQAYQCRVPQAIPVPVIEREASLTAPGPENEKYLRTKAESMGHHDLGHLFE